MVAELELDDLKALRVLGRGAMGTVFLVTPRSNNNSLPRLFALKVIEKQRPDAKPDLERRARWELEVLSKLSSSGSSPHPFLPALVGRLETSNLIGWGVPFCAGGDLHSLLSPDAAFSTAAIRFYLSEIISAIDHLHSLRIAYRDLKPENILLQSSGHLTLTDFDLSRHLPQHSSAAPSPLQPLPKAPHRRNLTRILALTGMFPAAADGTLKKARSARVSPVSRRKASFTPSAERSYSFVGTEEYVSPEVVRGEGHGFAVDWWALGILTYEMAYGRTPFKGRSRKETFKNVLTKAPELGRQSELTDLIERLLAKEPERRLGFAGGAVEVKGHPFFEGVQWDLLCVVERPPFLAPVEELEEEVLGPGGYGRGEGFDVRDYFEGLRKPPASPLVSSAALSES